MRSRGRPDGAGLRILFYHRVSDDDDPLAVSPRRFREQMELLAAGGYEVVDLAAAVDLLERGLSPPRVVALNFDDGYRDVAENALPVLERLGFRATVFLPTGVIDGTASFPWYDRQPPVLGWDEVVELDRGETLRFEPHTVTHPNLLLLDDAASRFEIAQSKLDLEATARPAGSVVLLPGRAVRRAGAPVRRRVGVPRGGLLRAGSQPARAPTC